MIHWYVYVESFNARTIEKRDLFAHGAHIKEIAKMFKKCGDDKDAFTKELRSELMYYYWARCEWEVIITSWPPSPEGTFKDVKIDVFDQLNMNWDVFVDYIWNNRKEIMRDSRKKS